MRRFLGYGLTALVLVLLFHPSKMLLTVLLLALTWYYAKDHPNPKNAAIVISVGLLFTLAEMTAVQWGIWTYRSPDIYGVPIWLFPLWGLVGLILYHRDRRKT